MDRVDMVLMHAVELSDKFAKAIAEEYASFERMRAELGI